MSSPPARARASNALPVRHAGEEPSILFVGLDWEQKGGPLLLEAFRRVRRLVPDARLIVIGCRPAGVREEPGVELIGRLDRSKPLEDAALLGAYASATCFCIAPHVTWFPNVLLEAAGMGLPCVSTSELPRGELVVDGETGTLVAPDDPRGPRPCARRAPR